MGIVIKDSIKILNEEQLIQIQTYGNKCKGNLVCQSRKKIRDWYTPDDIQRLCGRHQMEGWQVQDQYILDTFIFWLVQHIFEKEEAGALFILAIHKAIFYGKSMVHWKLEWP